MRFILLVALAALVASGAQTSAGERASVRAQLRITVWPRGPDGRSAAYTLRCPSGEGTLPGAARACARLAELGRQAFAPVPRDAFCTEIYAGPQVARVTGLLQGRKLWATFRRTDGCQIERWNRLAFLFPLGPQAGTRPPIS
jgi:hypothetical protein